MHAIASPFRERYIDGVYNRSGSAYRGDVHSTSRSNSGVQSTVLCIVVFASTFTTKGAKRASLILNEGLYNKVKLPVSK